MLDTPASEKEEGRSARKWNPHARQGWSVRTCTQDRKRRHLSATLLHLPVITGMS